MPNPPRMALVVIPFFVFAGVWLAFRRGFGPMVLAWSEWAREVSGATLSWLYLGVGAAAILAVLLAAVLIGSVRVGGPQAPIRVTPGEAIAVGFGAATSVGLLFWAAGEPLFHVYRPPAIDGIRPLSPEARIIARSAAMLHWGILAHMTFGLFMIGFAVATGTLGARRSVESVIAGARLRQRAAWGDLLDGVVFIFAILALVAALASAVVSITAQGLAISGTPLPGGVLTGVLVALVLTSVFIGARPVGRSLAAVSRVSLGVFLVLMLIVILLGPKGAILGGGAKALWLTIREFPGLMFEGFLDGAGGWAGQWTITHLGGWMLLAPLVGYALSRAAQGYTLAEAICYLVIVPMLLSILCILVLGGLTVAMDRRGDGAIWAALPTMGTDSALLLAMNELWMPKVLRVVLLLLSILFFVTFAGAATHAILHIVVPGEDSNRRVIAERRALLFVWALAFGFGGWCLLHQGGMGVIASVSRLGAIPGVFITLGAVLAVFRLCMTPVRKLYPPVEEVDPGHRRASDKAHDAAEVVGTVKRGHRRN